MKDQASKITTLANQLADEESGVKVHDLLSTIAGLAGADRTAVMEALVQYAEMGRLQHCRSAAICELCDLLTPRDKRVLRQGSKPF